MVFSSVIFLFYFLPVFLMVYYLLPDRTQVRNIWFFIASLIFVFWTENWFIGILLSSIIINYTAGRLMDQPSDKKRRLFFLLGLVLNLGILVYFKYSPFFADQMIALNEGNALTDYLKRVHQPLGISFFTFQGISYLFDVYRKKIPSEKRFINIAGYISMFPQFISGPIVRYSEIREAMLERRTTYDKFAHGVVLFIIGLGYKVLIADVLSVPVDFIYAHVDEGLNFWMAWLGAISFSLQIYFDFNGYSTMAVGLGLMVGIKFPLNFNFPYLATSITDFWRRWHITLSLWFRDYLYIPLGGNRVAPWRVYFNLSIVFLLCGFWHGASWVFIIWGLYHGILLVIERVYLLKILNKLPKVLRQFYSVFFVVIGFAIFRAPDINTAMAFLGHLFEPDLNNPVSNEGFLNSAYLITLLIAVLLCTPLVNRMFFKETAVLTTYSQTPKMRFKIVYYGLLFLLFGWSVIHILNTTFKPFIYFKF